MSKRRRTLASAAQAAGVNVVLINAPMGAPGSFGTGCLPDRSELFRAELAQAAEYAERLGAPFVNVLAGSAAPA